MIIDKYINDHHYLAQSSKVAKLFATHASKALEKEPFYKALNQVLNAMLSMRNRPISDIIFTKNQKVPEFIIQFPVVVCNSFEKIYSVDFYKESQPELIQDNFQLEVRYAYIERHTEQDEYFLLDFVEFNQLNKYVEAIEMDVYAAINSMNFQKDWRGHSTVGVKNIANALI